MNHSKIASFVVVISYILSNNVMFSDFRFLRQKYKHFTETPTARNTQNEEEYIHDVLIEKKMNCVAIEVLSLFKILIYCF